MNPNGKVYDIAQYEPDSLQIARDSIGKAVYIEEVETGYTTITAFHAIEHKSGTADIINGADEFDKIKVDTETVFAVMGKDNGNEWCRTYIGNQNVPTIYDAEYHTFVSEQGRQFVCIPNGQNAINYESSGRFFLVDPSDYETGMGSSRQNKYYATQGTYNDVVGAVKFTDSAGKTFFESSPKPGLYLGAQYQGMRVTNTSGLNPSNPLAARAGSASLPSNAPLQGISLANDSFSIGTNQAFRSEFGVSSAISITVADLSAQAYSFNIDASGKVTSSSCKLSEVKSDDKAYVWGTVDSSGKLTNLYIVHSESAKWNAQWTAESATDPESGMPASISSAQVFMVNPESFGVYGSNENTYYTTEGTLNKDFLTLEFDSDCGGAFFGSEGIVLPGIYRGVNVRNGKISDMHSTTPVNQLWQAVPGNDGENPFPMVGISCDKGVFQIGTNEELNFADNPISLIAANPDGLAFCFNIDSRGNITSEARKLSEVVPADNAYVWGTMNNSGTGTMISNLYIVYCDDSNWMLNFG